jgi:radical SAM-linked protein
MIYRPVRERSPENLLEMARKSLDATGYEEVSLLSLSTGDYSCLDGLMQALMGRCYDRRVAVSLPSIRADSLTATLMSQIKRVRKTGFTIAPEAGSQRLRDVINKSLTEQEIVSTVKNAIGLGWKVIKLYFMIGLPTETDADIVALISLVKKLRSLKSAENKRYNYNLHVSVATFIPKPHTPFQWSRQICLEESKAKIRMIKDALVKGCGVQVKWQNPEVSLIEGVFSRGDRTLSSLLVSAYRKGCRFDGWTDSFDFRKWKAAAEEIRLDLEGYATRTIAVDDPLAWDHIDLGIHPRYLKEELKKSESGMPTEDCRWGNCQNCGICDFKDVKPVVYDGYQGVFENIGETASEGEKWKKLFVSYQKVGSARFFGHLELVKIFSRAFHRAAIPMKYTEGFHPHPRLSFGNPLPVGMESLKEQVVITVEDAYDETRFESMVNPRLPEGLLVTGCSTYDDGPGERDSRLRFQIELNGDRFEQEKVDSFFESDVWLISRKSKRGKKRDIDIRKQVKGLRIIAPNRLSMEMVQDENGVAQPKEIIRSIFFLSEEAVMKARIMKRPGCRSEL